MITADDVLAVLAEREPAFDRSSLDAAANALASWVNALPAEGTAIPADASPVTDKLFNFTDIEGGVKIGDVVLGSQLKIVVAPDKVPQAFDVTPDYPFQATLVGMLDPDQAVQLEEAAKVLHHGPAKRSDELFRWQVAAALLKADRKAISDFALKLASVMGSLCPGRVEELATYAWPFTLIPREARVRIAANPGKPVDERGVAVNTDRVATALNYVKYAPLPARQVRYVTVGPAAGEETQQQLRDRVMSECEAQLGSPLAKYLKIIESRQKVLFILLQWNADEAQLTGLRADFRLATFVVLTGTGPFPTRALEKIKVEYLSPALAADAEASADDDWAEFCDDLTWACKRPGGQ